MTRSPEIHEAERALWERVFQQQHAAVVRTAYRITGSAADAEDVLQSVFLRFLRLPPAGIADPAAYLRRAAAHAAIDLLRRRALEPRAELDDLPAPGPDALTLLALRRALGRLPARAAEIVALRYFEDLPNRDIAALLGITQTAVALTLHRAKRKLRKDLPR